MALPKSLTEEQFEIKHANEVELAKRELARRALDIVRVFNPLKTDFVFMYDRYYHKVPARSTKDMDRYLAMHFFKKICDFMIGQQIMAKGAELKKMREDQMGHEFLDHYEENVQVWDKVPKLNDAELINEIRKIVILGVVEEYGMEEEAQQEMPVPETPLDFRGAHEQAFDNIGTISKDAPSPVSEVKPETTAPISDVPQESTQPPVYVSKKDREKLDPETITNENGN